jgi:hypothetical protein
MSTWSPLVRRLNEAQIGPELSAPRDRERGKLGVA